MGIKELLFSLFLIFSVSVPLFFKQKDIQFSKKVKLPNMEIKEGNFKQFSDRLKELGVFKKIDYFNESNYSIYNLKMIILEKDATLSAKKVYFDGSYYNLYNFYYKNDKFDYNSDKIVYEPRSKIARADYFTFFSKKIEGQGKKMVYKNDIITAHNIHYFLKGFE